MKRFLLFFITLLSVACSNDEPIVPDANDEVSPQPEYLYSDGDFLSINGDKIDVEIVEGKVYAPTSLASDIANIIDVNIDPAYALYIDDVRFFNGVGYELVVDKLLSAKSLELRFVRQDSGEVIISQMETLPDMSWLDPITINVENPPLDGVYYTGFKEYIFKLSTAGDVVYYRKCENPRYFNRSEFDGKVYYSYLDAHSNPKYPKIIGVGYKQQKAVIMDEHYRVIDTIEGTYAAGDVPGGVPLESHQFRMLGPNHYLIATYLPQESDNIPGVSAALKVVASVMQEIKDGEVVFNWKSTEHSELYGLGSVASSDSASSSYIDYLHVNSSDIDTDGNWLISCRTISSIVKIDRVGGTGNVIWVLGGKGDNFGLEGLQLFRGQHDIKVLGEGEFTIFNNNFYAGEKGVNSGSGTMRFRLDEQNHSVDSFFGYHTDGLFSSAEGSAQMLTDERYVFGWGTKRFEGPIFSEESTDGTVHFSAGCLRTPSTYKVYKYDK